MKYLRRYNESVRDMLKPKSEEDIKKSMGKKKYHIYKSLRDAKESVKPPFETTELIFKEISGKLASYFGINLRFLPFSVSYDGELWTVSYAYNRNMVNNNYNTWNETWDGIVEFTDQSLTEEISTIEKEIKRHQKNVDELKELLSEIALNNKSMNESVRDAMKPKSDEDIKKSLQGLDPRQKMEKAIKHNMTWLAQEAIDDGIDFEQKTGGGRNLLGSSVTDAMRSGSVEILKLLMDKGGEIDVPDYYLGEAINKDHLEMAKFLIANGADPYTEEESYIEMAVNHNDLEMLKLLLDNGVDEHFDDDWFRDTVLDEQIDSEIIKYMMQKLSGARDQIIRMNRDYKKGVKILSKYV
jgi:hypothetical protein